MYYTVYKITNKINGKIYIGIHQTEDLDDGYMGSGKYLRRSIEKHGIENFEKEILSVFDSKEAMLEMESTLVNTNFVKRKDTYNLKEGGDGGWDHLNTPKGVEKRRWTFEVWRKSGTDRFLELFYNDSAFREETLSRLKVMRERSPGPPTFKGLKHKEDTKRKMSQVAKERLKDPTKNTQYGTMWITDGVNSKKIKKDNSIPEGWKRGRVMVK